MARAKRKLPAKPAAFMSPHHRGLFCRRHPIPEPNAPPPTTIHTPQKPHDPVKRHRPTPEHKKPAAAPNTAGRFHFSATPQSLLPPSSDTRTQSPRRRRQYTPHKNLTTRSNGTDRRPNTKNPLPLRTPPAAFISPQHRSHFCRRHPIPEHKAPAADDNTHPTKTSRPGQTAPTDTRTQKNPLPLRTPPAVSAFSKKTAALPKCHSSAPTTAGRRTTPPHTT